MHLCLSCNQPCSISSIFCDSCRLSLLERRAAEKQEEQPEMVKVGHKVGNREEGMADLVSPPQMEAVEVASVRLTEGEYLWSWDTSGIYRVETQQDAAAEAQSSGLLMLSPPPPARRTMPRRVRRALLIFIIVGIVALSTDGVLLALSIMRHHTQPQAADMPRSATLPAQLSNSPVAGGLATPTPTSMLPPLNDALALSTSRLLFTVTYGQADPAPQTVALLVGGHNAFSWRVTSTSSIPSWLHLSSVQGSAAAGASVQFMVSVQAAQLAPQTYTATLLVHASNNEGKEIPGSPQTLTVTLSVLVPCSLSVTPTKLTFNANLLQPVPPAQMLTLTESGGCAWPITWQVSASASWVTFASASGVDNGSGSTIVVQARNPGKLVGSSTAFITLQVSDSYGSPVSGSPVTIPVTLLIIG